ncbi:MAG TPA: small, acid-soluble spore protein, alpha/beta type [Gelria sp.]|jgi:small acid-soluble spore protein F (minor alpha/beta-type SASP)|nr:small, acid-soluble spore protein, alpha/beta type [Gelria sp.]
MPAKKKKSKPLDEKEKLKLEIARELGILEQVENEGWGSLNNAMCGKVGGLMSKRLRSGTGKA